MRELKFRAWDKDTNTMHKVEELDFVYFDRSPKAPQGIVDDIWFHNDNESHIPSQTVLMQYTGLKDKNDKEIFEGDIVKTCEGYLGEVVWQDNSWKYRFKFKKTYQGESYVEEIYNNMSATDDKRWGDEVIGNIYENQELVQ